jgi:hypothetical protein
LRRPTRRESRPRRQLGVRVDGSTVAINKSRLVDKKQLKDLSKEFLILSQINHMNVVKLLGCSCLNRYIHGDG